LYDLHLHVLNYGAQFTYILTVLDLIAFVKCKLNLSTVQSRIVSSVKAEDEICIFVMLQYIVVDVLKIAITFLGLFQQ